MHRFEVPIEKPKSKKTSLFNEVKSVSIYTFSDKNLVRETLDFLSKLLGQKFPISLTEHIENSLDHTVMFNLQDGRFIFVQKVGERKNLHADTFRRFSSVLMKRFNSLKIKENLFIPAQLSNEEVVTYFKNHEYYLQTYLEGFSLGDYKFDQYLSKKDNNTITIFPYYPELKNERIQQVISWTNKLMKNVYLCRDLQNKPSNELTPAKLAEFVKSYFKKFKLIKVKVYDFDEIKKMKMGGLVAVGKGSENHPYFIVLEYYGAKNSDKKYVLVGKGITFDSGGISLKPAQGMWEMKGDMSGAAVVLSTISSAADLNLKVNLVGLLPVAENMPSGSSMKPGDIIKTASGKSIEIDNTDAEGRLILADALEYATRYKPEFVIDLATLTGACVVALGQFAAGFFTRSDELADKVISAANLTSERVWRLPLWDDYHNLIKSDFADVKNVGGRWAGAITAACFLEKFVDEKYKWAHLDIAGPAFSEDTIPYNSKTMTGYGVRLLIELFKRLEDKN